ncbi:MAG: hypothetical protein Q7T22_09930, partial [Serpentinimonas sp.]|nr:hypothetical protein [Serpentinimonas sp.]
MLIVSSLLKTGKNTTSGRTPNGRSRPTSGTSASTISRRRRKKMIRSDQGGREEKGSFRSAEEESFQNGVERRGNTEALKGLGVEVSPGSKSRANTQRVQREHGRSRT